MEPSITSPIGRFLLDDKGKILKKEFFAKNPKKIAKIIMEDMAKEASEELLESSSTFRKEFRSLAKESGMSGSELNTFLSDVGVELTKLLIKKYVKKDRIVIEAVNAVDEIDKSVNILIARLREWYGLHFPEMNRVVDKHDKYSKIIADYGLRDNITSGELKDLAKESMGIDLSDPDEKVLIAFSEQILGFYKLREKIEKYIDKTLAEFAPNFSALAGPLLGARLISLAGGFEKLAKKPSSTIQLLGAEKSLFRYLRGRGKSPKHGVLYHSPYIQNVHPSKRGKIARILASKLSIAVKMDYYGKENKGEEMKKDLEEKIKKTTSGDKNG